MADPISSNYSQQITAAYNQKIDAADDNLQRLQERMSQIEKDPTFQRFKDSWIGNLFPQVREYKQLQAQLPGVQASTNATIDALRKEMANALKIEQEGSKALQAMHAAGQAVTVNVKDLDIESAMMLVQMNRANQLENQLKDQITEIQNRNKQIAEINNLLATVRNARPSGEKDPEGKISASVMDAVKQAGVDLPSGASLKDGTYTMKQSDFDKVVENLKAKIDSLNSTQQMDMIRLQSLTNKRNEAFEIMTNFISKMAKTRDSIVGNMR